MARSLLLHLTTALAMGGTAVAPAWVQAAEPQPTAAAAKAPEIAPEPDRSNFIEAWAIANNLNNLNNLFNERLYPGGKAVSTVGTSGEASAGATRLSCSELRGLGRWQSWGNGDRIDYSNGWTDWIYVGTEGLDHASWQPGLSRSSVPFNLGPAVKLTSPTAQVFGVYSFPPAQADLKPYTATLLSNGLAFNDLDVKSGGVWRLDG